METPSYESLYKAILELLPDCLTGRQLIHQHISNHFDPGLINYDPYHELLPTYYSFHKKGEPSSDCCMSSGIKHTTHLLHTMLKNKDIDSLPNLIIAACYHDILKQVPPAASEAASIYISTALKQLSESNYPLWHHACKHYLPAPNNSDTTFLLDYISDNYATDVPALQLVTTFINTFSQYDIIYHGYSEDCYHMAEKYKLELLNKYLS